MTANTQSIVLGFNGGFVTDLPDQARQLNYFLKAENVIYEVDGGIHKIGGTEPILNGPLGGVPAINGMFDFWVGDGAGGFTQNFIIVTAAGEIYKDGFDGTAVNITGALALGSDPIPVFCVARDTLTIWFSNGTAPAKYTGSGNCAALGGSPPSGTGAVFHANRLFAWGAVANPSRLYYGSSTSIEDWSGVDTGSIDFDINDGDKIVGVAAYRGSLIVFKGPNKGSIHVLSGTAPTGADAFSRRILSRGTALQTHNSIVQVGNELFFMSETGIHSLSATQEFGNFNGADETRFLKKFFRGQINQSQRHRVWGVDYAEKSLALWAVPGSDSSTNNLALGFSYVRLQEDGMKSFTINRSCQSVAIRKNPTTRLHELVFGTSDGAVLRQDTTSRAESEASLGFDLDVDLLDTDKLGGFYPSQAYSMRVVTPQLLLAQGDKAGMPRGDQPFTLSGLWMRSASVGNYDVNITLTRDNETPEFYTFNQGQASFTLDESRLDVHRLGGLAMRLVHSEPRVTGTARAVQLDITQGGLDEDAHIFEIGIDISPDSDSRQSV